MRVAAQRVRGEAPHAAVGGRRRQVGRRGRGAAQAQPPLVQGSEEGAVARRVHGDHPGGRGPRLAVRARRRSPDVQQSRVPRWVMGGWVGGRMAGWVAFSSSPFPPCAFGLPSPPRCSLSGLEILISGGPCARDCALQGVVKLNYCVRGSCAPSSSYSAFFIPSSRKLVFTLFCRVGLQLVSGGYYNSASLRQFVLASPILT